MTEESSDQVKRIEDLTEDDIYGHPERDPRWIEAQDRVAREKSAKKIREKMAEKRRELLNRKFLNPVEKPSQIELQAYNLSQTKISEEELIKFLDENDLDLALKEALVQKYCDVNKDKKNFFAKLPPKETVTENYLIKQLKENRPTEPLKIPTQTPAPNRKLAAVPVAKK